MGNKLSHTVSPEITQIRAQPLFSLPTINDASPLLQSVAAPIPSAAAVVGFACGAFVFGSSCIAGIFCSRPILSPVPPSPPEAKLSWSLIYNTALAKSTLSFTSTGVEANRLEPPLQPLFPLTSTLQ